MLVGVSDRLLRSEPLRRCRLHECQAACCLHGVWIDLVEVKDLILHARSIYSFLPEARRDHALWFEEDMEVDKHSLSGYVVRCTVLADSDHYGGTACIFLRRDFRCALQMAGIDAGEHPWRFKPFYCILHPLEIDEQGCITLAETDELLAEEGSCLRRDDEPSPLIMTFEPELRYMLGDKRLNDLYTR